MEARHLKDTKFVSVVDTYPGYCQICHQPRVVARIAVAGCQHQGTICGQCLSGLADELERRGQGIAVEKVGSNGDALAAVLSRNGDGHSRESLPH